MVETFPGKKAGEGEKQNKRQAVTCYIILPINSRRLTSSPLHETISMLFPWLTIDSMPDGSIWKGDLSTGEGDVVVSGDSSILAVGMAHDRRSGYLFVAGGPSGELSMLDVEHCACARSRFDFRDMTKAAHLHKRKDHSVRSAHVPKAPRTPKRVHTDAAPHAIYLRSRCEFCRFRHHATLCGKALTAHGRRFKKT